MSRECCHDHPQARTVPAWLKRERTKNVSAYLPVETAAAIRAQAARDGVSVNQLVRGVLVERFTEVDA